VPAVSDMLARHIALLPSSAVTPAAMAAARRSLTDAIGVSLAASGLGDGCAAFRELAVEQGPGPCTVLGWGDRVSLQAAVMANGALAHAIDFEDVLDESPIHPNACAVAAALGVADMRGDVSGRDLLAAIAVGCDLVCRLALALSHNPDERGWYTPPILGAYGATAAAARLLRLDSQQTLDAIALTLAQVTCSNQFKSSPRSSVRAVRDAFAAHGGTVACLLAARGVAGFDQPIEGKSGLYALYGGGGFDNEALVGELGERFRGEEVSYKIWPACRGTHAFIEAALSIAGQPDFSPAAVTAIEARGPAFISFLAEPRESKAKPQTAIDAKFSIPFAIASALLNGNPGLAAFEEDAIADDRTRALAALVHFVPEGSGFRNANSGRLQVTLANGKVESSDVDAAFGHPSNPVSEADLEAKFESCAARAAVPPPASAIAAFLRMASRLETDLTDLGSRLMGVIHPAKEARA